MKDDLISRKDLLQALSHFNDYENGNKHYLNAIRTVEEIVQNIPAAFNKEKVIKEIEYDKRISERYGTGLREKGHIEAFDEAISIIKKGGIE